MPQIITPLKNIKLVVLALVANVVLAPIVAYLVILILPLSEPSKIGLILLGTAAGAPFLPKLAEVAKSNVAFSVGLGDGLVTVESTRLDGVEHRTVHGTHLSMIRNISPKSTRIPPAVPLIVKYIAQMFSEKPING